MATVALLSVTPDDDRTAYNLAPLRALREAARLDRFGRHAVTEDLNAADLILFAEFYGAGFHFERLRRHPVLRRFREKCFLFCSNAIAIPFLPGIYASMEKRWASGRVRGGSYLGVIENEFATFTPPVDDLPYLFSFIGSVANAPVRQSVAQLSHPRALVRDTTGEFARLLGLQMSAGERRAYHQRYADATKASKFILCPRGIGSSTIRLYETMRVGRVPVILSDDWLPPQGPRWEEFSFRVPESDVAEVPRFLESREADFVQMAQRARAAWEEWFADDVVFHRVVESCLAIRAQRRLPEALACWPVYLQYLRPFHFKRALRGKYETWRGRAGDEVARPSLASSGV